MERNHTAPLTSSRPPSDTLCYSCTFVNEARNVIEVSLLFTYTRNESINFSTRVTKINRSNVSGDSLGKFGFITHDVSLRYFRRIARHEISPEYNQDSAQDVIGDKETSMYK